MVNELMGLAVLTGEGAVDVMNGFDLSTIMASAVDTVTGQIFTTLGLVVPALVLVTGAVVGVRFGIKWLRSLGKN